MPLTTTPSTIKLSCQVLTSLDAIETLATPMAHLRHAAEDNQVWLNQSVLALWFQHFTGQTPFFVACFDEQAQLVAVAPLVRQRVDVGGLGRFIYRLQWLGTDPSVNDAARILIHPTMPLEPVMQEILRAILSSRWDMLDLRQCVDAAQTAFFASGLTQAGLPVQTTPGQPVSWVSLPASAEAYFETCRTKWLKRDLGRLERHLQRDYAERDFVLRTISAQAQDWNTENEAFFDRQAAYWQARGIRSEQDRFPALRAFYHDLQQAVGDDGHPVALLSQLSYGEHWLSSHVVLASAHTRMSHLTVYNPDFKYYRPGLFHLEKLMLGALDAGLTQYDLGRGDNQYKQLWKLDTAETTQITVIRSPWARLALKADAWLKDTLKKRTTSAKKDPANAHG